MENIAKKHGKLLCFAPFVLYSLWTIYFFALVQEEVVTSSISDHFAWVTAMTMNYTSLWISLTIICAITGSILLYFIVHLARLRAMPAGTKLFWMVILTTFGAFAFMVFYFAELRSEPTYVSVYPSIE